MQLRPRRRPALLFAVVGLGAGLLFAALLSAPRVVAVSPADQATAVPGRTSLRITFNRPMDRASVESRLTIDPRPTGTWRWDGAALVFQPGESWPAGGHVVIRLTAGSRSVRGLPLLGDREWSFDVGEPQVIYLWPAEGPADIYAQAMDSSGPVRLTNTDGVLDFRLTEDGSAVVYAALMPGGQIEIRRRETATGEDVLLYACPAGFVCRDGGLSPDGTWLAFEQQEPAAGSAPAGAMTTHVLLVPVGQGGEAVSIAASDHATSQPVWSARGWLAYYDNTLQAYAFRTEPGAGAAADRYVPNALGDHGEWSPDGETFVFPEMVFVAEAPTSDEGPPLFFSHLNRLDVRSGAILDLSGEEGFLVEDTGPAYSPDGHWLAFSRKYLDPGRWTLGRQLWRMRSDGLTPQALTDEPAFNHSGLAWSPDGQSLVYMRFDQIDMTRPAEIWWTAIDGSAGGLLAVGGYGPQWSP